MIENEGGFSIQQFFSSLTNKKAIVIIIIIGFIVYFFSLFNGFVWDDLYLISINAGHSLLNITNFFLGQNGGNAGISSDAHGYVLPHYRPISNSILSVFYSLFGNNAFFYHLFQLMLHITNACLVFIFFKYFLGKNLSFILSLVFLVHPINTEAVVYISALQEPLFFFFGMMAFVILNAYKLSNKRLLLGGLLILCSLLSKETGMLFLFTICIFHLIYKKSIAFKIIYSAASALGIYLITRLLIAKIFLEKLTSVPIMEASFTERLQNIPAVFFYYTKTFFYPKDLTISQHWLVKSLDLNTFYLPLFLNMFFLLIILSLGIYFWKFKKDSFKPYILFSIWFLLGMGIHLQIIPLDMTVAERWYYFTIIGLLGMIGVFLNYLTIKKHEIGAILLFITVLSVLSARTLNRTFDWKNQLTLYAHDATYNDSSFDLESNLGAELFRAGKKEEAKQHFERSIALAPEHWINWANLAGYYYRKGDYTNAEKYYNISIKNGPYFQPAYENYARLLLFDGNNGTRAKEFLEKSLKIFPQNGRLWLYLALTNYKLGLIKEALEAAKQSVQLTQSRDSLYVYNRLNQNLPLDIK